MQFPSADNPGSSLDGLPIGKRAVFLFHRNVCGKNPVLSLFIMADLAIGLVVIRRWR